METFLDTLTLSEVTFKILFIVYFVYSEKRHQRREEILLEKLERMAIDCHQKGENL